MGLFGDSLREAAGDREKEAAERQVRAERAAKSPSRQAAWAIVYAAHPRLLEVVRDFTRAAPRIRPKDSAEAYFITGIPGYQPAARYTGVASDAVRIRRVKAWTYYIEGHWFAVMPDGRWYKCGFLDDTSGDLREQKMFMRDPWLHTPDILFAHLEHENDFSPKSLETLPRMLDPAAHARALAKMVVDGA